MKTIGLTGSIGSGKTTVSKIIENIGYPVFNSDIIAKEQLSKTEIINAIVRKFGNNILLQNGLIDKKKLSTIVFDNTQLLTYLNSIIHPLVLNEFNQWKMNLNAPIVFMESAIIFEQNLENQFDKIISVWAPIDLCINRCLERDSLSKEEINARILRQMSPEEKRNRSDFVIINDEKEAILPQVLIILKEIEKI